MRIRGRCTSATLFAKFIYARVYKCTTSDKPSNMKNQLKCFETPIQHRFRSSKVIKCVPPHRSLDPMWPPGTDHRINCCWGCGACCLLQPLAAMHMEPWPNTTLWPPLLILGCPQLCSSGSLVIPYSSRLCNKNDLLQQPIDEFITLGLKSCRLQYHSKVLPRGRVPRAVLNVKHTIWSPLSGRFDGYVRNRYGLCYTVCG